MKVTLIHLVIAVVHCFQFHNRILSRFSEWHILMDKSHPRCEIQRVFQQFLQTVIHSLLVVNGLLRTFFYKQRFFSTQPH